MCAGRDVVPAMPTTLLCFFSVAREGSPTMYKLYWCRGTAALAPQLVLELGGLPYEKITVETRKGEHRKAAYLAINPKGFIPALQTPEGQILTEAAAICLYLCERHALPLAPAPGTEARGPFLSLLVFLTNTLQTACKPCDFPERFALDPADAPRVRAWAVARLDDLWRMVEDHLFSGPGPFLQGPEMTVADLYLAMVMAWHPRAHDRLAELERVGGCFEAVTAEPTVARVMRASGNLPLG